MGQRQENAPMFVRGEIVTGRAITGPITVELSSNTTLPAESATVNADNTFEFRSATQGTHLLRVVGPDGQVLYQENVNISSPVQTISVRLPEAPASANRSSGSVISLQQLQHKVPPAARKAFEKGEQAISKGDLLQARSQFQEAVTIDPEFADAYNELGGVESGLKHLPEAAEQFQKAIDLAPQHPMALPNLSIVLAKMQRLHEAGQVAKRALQVTPNDGRMHYILGASLLAEDGTFEQVIAEFERAADTVRSAHVIAAELLAKQGRSEEAIRHLEAFLATAPADDALRPKAEARLAALRH
jgi:tetratricopeptide (TPR) repeat protein